jgi:hypothetical protein
MAYGHTRFPTQRTLVDKPQNYLDTATSFGNDVDRGRLAGMWHYLEGKYLLPFACTKKPLTCLVLDP